jgi:hypothetical protein
MSNYGSLLDSGQFVAGVVCTDCMFGVLYGDWPTDSHWTQERAETSQATLAKYEVTLGHVHEGPYSQCPHAGTPCEDDCECERDPFSHSPCSVCGSSLAGERREVIMIARADLR